MPVSNLTVTNTSGVPYDQRSLLAGANKTVAVQTNDGLTSYIADGNVGHRQCGNVGWPDFVARVHPTIRSFSDRDRRRMWRAYCSWRRPVIVW
jgi:hypothetical protein